MKAEHINPFIAATVHVFSKLLGCSLERGKPCLASGAQPRHHLSGVIGLSGKAAGTVVLSMDRGVAIRAAEVLLHERREEVDADVVDTIGELTNMIAGAAKADLDQFEMSVTLPSVIVGRNHSVQFPSKAPPICVPFHSPWGPLCLEVSLVEPAETGLRSLEPASL